MNFSPETIDRIVANVLNRFSPVDPIRAQSPVPKSVNLSVTASAVTVELQDAVVTAERLEKIPHGSQILVGPKTIITPAARDIVRASQLQLARSAGRSTTEAQHSKSLAETSRSRIGAVIVRHTPEVERALEDLILQCRELQGCPDDAAKFAISELCRGSVDTLLLFAEQTHRAACLANRNDRVKAVVIADAGDVPKVRKQIRANVWCIDPTDRSYYELKNTLKVIAAGVGGKESA